MEKQLNMEILIKKIFDSAEKHTQKMRVLYTDKADLVLFDKEVSDFLALRKIAESLPGIKDWNARYDTAQKLQGISIPFMPFMKPNSQDNSIYIAFRQMVHALSEYYKSSNDFNEKNFLMCYKRWCYKMSNNRFKDFIYPFMSASYLAERAQKDVSK